MDFNIIILRNNLRILMYRNNMIIFEFSEFVDLPVETVRSIIYGKCNDCKLSTIFKISGKFHVSIDILTKKPL